MRRPLIGHPILSPLALGPMLDESLKVAFSDKQQIPADVFC
jgi:hypothetical protein